MTAMSTEIGSMVKTLPRPLIVKITCGAEAAERANQGWTVAAMGLGGRSTGDRLADRRGGLVRGAGGQPASRCRTRRRSAELVETVRARRKYRV